MLRAESQSRLHQLKDEFRTLRSHQCSGDQLHDLSSKPGQCRVLDNERHKFRQPIDEDARSNLHQNLPRNQRNQHVPSLQDQRHLQNESPAWPTKFKKDRFITNIYPQNWAATRAYYSIFETNDVQVSPLECVFCQCCDIHYVPLLYIQVYFWPNAIKTIKLCTNCQLLFQQLIFLAKSCYNFS